MTASPPGTWAVDDLVVTVGARRVLDGVSFTLDPGEMVALVGPSGAGKTTLLRSLAGMVAPTSGRVLWNGTDVSAVPRRERARLVGMMQQRLDLVNELSVRHNIEAGLLGRLGPVASLAALLLPLEAAEAREAARRVGLEDRLDERLERLSGGEQQRVALARLLVQGPQLLLADEPVASLDPTLATRALTLLAEGARDGSRTILVSLHVPQLATQHFDRVIGLHSGVVAFDRVVSEVDQELLGALYGGEEPS